MAFWAVIDVFSSDAVVFAARNSRAEGTAKWPVALIMHSSGEGQWENNDKKLVSLNSYLQLIKFVF
jgi:hypothetical protein